MLLLLCGYHNHIITITQYEHERKSYNTTKKCYWFFDRHMDVNSHMLISLLWYSRYYRWGWYLTE